MRVGFPQVGGERGTEEYGFSERFTFLPNQCMSQVGFWIGLVCQELLPLNAKGRGRDSFCTKGFSQSPDLMVTLTCEGEPCI